MSECILVADDDREIVKAIAILLEREGYKVLRAYDGLEALDLLAQNQVQLILMDVMMPRMDGLSAIMKIRERKNIPIIVLSAKSEDTDKVLGLSMGADDYVTKPYNSQELLARVKSHLRRYTRLGDIHAASASKEFKSGRLCYHAEERVLYADGESIRLTATDDDEYTQGVWMRRSDLDGVARGQAGSFTIGNKGYVNSLNRRNI